MQRVIGDYGSVTRGKASVAFGTVINMLIPGKRRYYTRLTTLAYTAAGTPHTLTVFRPVGTGTTVSVAAAAGAASLTLTAQPNSLANVAANDYVAWENADGSVSFDLVASVAAGPVITMTSVLPKAVAAGARFWFFGITTEVNTDGFAHPQFTGVASATTTYQDIVSGIAVSLRPGEPLLIQSNNATATGTIERAAAVYTAA